jgi:hypothetical protein
VVPGSPGGIKALNDLVDEYADELEADFLEFYRVDLTDVWRGALTPRRALVLVGQLVTSTNSRYRAASLGTDAIQFVGYGRLESMTADLIDRISELAYITAKANGGKPRKPTPYPRPEVNPDITDSAVTATDIDDFPIWDAVALTTK